MTRDETILELETMLAKYAFDADEALSIGEALTALRGPTREMVERMRGEWVRTHSTDNFWTEVWKCSYCGFEDDNGDCFDFCPECGQPKTDDAVDMMLERWKEACSIERNNDRKM